MNDDDNFYNYSNNKKQVAVDHLLSALLIPGDDTARFCRFAHWLTRCFIRIGIYGFCFQPRT